MTTTIKLTNYLHVSYQKIHFYLIVNAYLFYLIETMKGLKSDYNIKFSYTNTSEALDGLLSLPPHLFTLLKDYTVYWILHTTAAPQH